MSSEHSQKNHAQIRAARTVENGLYLVVLIIWATHFLALFRALRGTSLAPPGATPADQATLVLIWQATQGIFNALLVTGLVMLRLSLVALGVTMLGAPAFGKGYGRAGVALGVVGVGAAFALLVDPLSFIAVVGIFALIVFHLVLGWKVYGLSR